MGFARHGGDSSKGSITRRAEVARGAKDKVYPHQRERGRERGRGGEGEKEGMEGLVWKYSENRNERMRGRVCVCVKKGGRW